MPRQVDILSCWLHACHMQPSAVEYGHIAMHVWRAHLLHVVQVLHAWRLAQIDPMCNVLAQHESADQVICIASLSCEDYTYN